MRYVSANCGRRYGKTFFGGQKSFKHSAEGDLIWWIAPNYSPTGEAGWQYLKSLGLEYARVEPATKFIDSEPYSITFPNRGHVEVRSGENPQKLRSAGLHGVVLDEFAFMQLEVWEDAVRPALLDKKGWAMFISTPFGKNHHYDMFNQGYYVLESIQTGPRRRDRTWIERINPGGNKRYASFHFTTYDNPFIDPDELDELEKTMPEMKFRREILAEFIDDAGSVFRLPKDICKIEIGSMQYDPNHTYVIGADWGRVNDFTVFIVIDVTTRQVVDMDRFNQIDFPLQRQRLMAACAKWHPSIVWAEENAVGVPVINDLQRDGVPVRGFYTSGTSKGPLVDALALAIERGDLELLTDREMKKELTDYTAEPMKSGTGYKYSAPPGGHDDIVIALALAWHGANRTGVVSFSVLE